jgi:hypothetical protein
MKSFKVVPIPSEENLDLLSSSKFIYSF